MIIYEIRRILDNRPYTGYSTKFNSSEEFLASNYWGSGTYITPAIKKYGKKHQNIQPSHWSSFNQTVVLTSIIGNSMMRRQFLTSFFM